MEVCTGECSGIVTVNGSKIWLNRDTGMHPHCLRCRVCGEGVRIFPTGIEKKMVLTWVNKNTLTHWNCHDSSIHGKWTHSDSHELKVLEI